MAEDIVPEMLNTDQAAKFLGVSKTFFEDHIRPYVSFSDLRSPGAKKPMPRWSRTDLTAFIESRRKERKAS